MNKLLVGIATLLLAACTTIPYYNWYKAGPSSTHRKWDVMSVQDVHRICGSDKVACAWQLPKDTCIIISYMGEDFAHWYRDQDGLTLYEHEHKHCDGERH